MRQIGGVAIFWTACLALPGCASTQLNYNTLDLAGTVGDIQTQQVLYNLSLLHDNPGAIPTHVDLASGTASTSNSVSPTLSAPIASSAQTMLQTTANLSNTSSAVATANEIQRLGTRAATSLSVGAQDAWTQSWNYDPVVDGDELRRLRALYKFVLGSPFHYACARGIREVEACAPRSFDRVDLIEEYPPVTKGLSVSYSNNDPASSSSIYCQNIGVTSELYLTNASNKTVDKNGLTLEDFVAKQEKLNPWIADPNDPNCAPGAASAASCLGTSSGISGKVTKQQWDQHWNAAWMPGRMRTTCSAVTNTIQLPDEAYLRRPSCILCLASHARTALYKGRELVVNERLVLLEGGGHPWLIWDADGEDLEFLGHYGKHNLFVRRADKWKLSELTLFVMTATAQSAAANAANGTSGGQKKGGNNPGPAQVIGSGLNTIQVLQPIGPGLFRAQ